MQRIQLGKTDVQVSSFIQGSWIMGKDYWGGAEDQDSIEAIRAAFENGINTIDTAYIYGKGHAERVVGEAIKGISRRDLVLVTKLWKTDMGKDRAQKGLEEAMERMGTDYVDVFFLHYPVDDVPIEETMQEMMRFKKEGKIRAIGVSNFSLAQMKEALQYGDIDVIQPCYSLLWRFIDRDILPFCIENSIGVIPYSPLGQGLLTGYITKDEKFREGDNRPTTPLFAPENFGNALQVTEVVKEIAAKYGRTPAQTAINWLTGCQGITAPIIGGKNRAEVEDNVKAFDWKLSPEDFAVLNETSKKFAYALPNYKNLFDKTIEA